MREKYLVFCLCVLLVAFAIPALATEYAIQGESIPASSDWDRIENAADPTDPPSAIQPTVIADPDADNGYALQIADDSTLDADVIMLSYSDPEGFNGSATAVVRIKTSDAAEFSTARWQRNIILSFAQNPDGSTRRGIGLAIRPDSAAVTNTLGSRAYGNWFPNDTDNIINTENVQSIVENAGDVVIDNTQYVIWTIVSRNYGYSWDLYYNGIKLFENVDGKSATESDIGFYYNGSGAVGADALIIGVMDSNTDTGTGAWVVDWAAVRPGEHPDWIPNIPDIPEPGSLLALSTGLVGLISLIRRKTC